MPQALSLTPPNFSKRQRSQERSSSRPASTRRGRGASITSAVSLDEQVQRMTVKMPKYLTKTKAQISSIFTELEWQQRSRIAAAFNQPDTSPFKLERSQVITSRNRYAGVQPWQMSRIKLKTPIGGSDYINASPIVLKSQSQPDATYSTLTLRLDGSEPDPAPTRYIATQGPKDGQFSHFWHMVMQETPGTVGVIIMLTQLVEGNREKCASYFPLDFEEPVLYLPLHEDSDDGQDGEALEDGDPFLDSPLSSADTDGDGTDPQSENQEMREEQPKAKSYSGTVTLESVNYDSTTACEVRRLRLTIGDESKEIYHYFFQNWPDFGKPEAEDRAALLELTRVSKLVAGDSPRIVHCSAGVGRTGTWIALDFLLRDLEEGRLLEPVPSVGNSTSNPTSSGASDASWGKSGPAKARTPELKEEDDRIFSTVNSLREQRMMMVMNELQYSFIYEVLRDAFIEKYAAKEHGPIVIELQEPRPKITRRKSPLRNDDGEASEAETDIMDHENAGLEDKDPYAAAIPDRIQESTRGTE